MGNISEQEHIKRFVSGDNGAFNFIIRKWQVPVYEIAYRYVGSKQDAKDICQNTFVSVYRNLKKLKDNASFSTWIYRIAVNLCKDELKKRKRKINLDLSFKGYNKSGSDSLVEVNPDFEEDMMKKDIQEIIKRAVNSLSEEQKVVVILKEYQGLKFREVAEILKISENTAKSRMYYALKNIKSKLESQNLDKEVYSR